jgi:hypothetical protein
MSCNEHSIWLEALQLRGRENEMLALDSLSLRIMVQAFEFRKDLAHSNLSECSKQAVKKSYQKLGRGIPSALPRGAKCLAQSLTPSALCFDILKFLFP